MARVESKLVMSVSNGPHGLDMGKRWAREFRGGPDIFSMSLVTRSSPEILLRIITTSVHAEGRLRNHKSELVMDWLDMDF